MSNNKKYWKNLAELNSANNDVFDELQNKEFVQEIPVMSFYLIKIILPIVLPQEEIFSNILVLVQQQQL